MNIVFFLEEPSAEEMLKGLLPRIIPENVYPKFVIFEGKSDLDKQITRKLRAWRIPDAKFIILRDQDSGDCRLIKKSLVEKCVVAGYPDALVRIACTEIESWYIGDLKAVEQGLKITGISEQQQKAKYRLPDDLKNAAEELEKITKGKYQKIAGSREIGKFLTPDNNLSKSYNVFMEGLMDVLSGKR